MTSRLLWVVLALAACKKNDAPKVALLLPESKTARYETQDRPLFEQALKKHCEKCELLYSNAGQDAARQQQQAEAALTNGAKVLVLDPVDGVSAKAIAERAHAAGVAVIAYDRAIRGTDAVDRLVTFDAEMIGAKQAEALLTGLGVRPALPLVVLINGSPTDDNAAQLKRGMHQVLAGKVEIVAEYDTPDWSPDKAQQEMTQALTALGSRTLDGVYAANDGTAGGVIAAVKAAGIAMPIITGQDAEAAAVQRIANGDQYCTIYKAIGVEAEAAAKLAAEAAQGKLQRGEPVVLKPDILTRANLKTVFDQGFLKRTDVCTGTYAAACADAGI
ncbi:MAG: substrate-binding domain-containing protein [Myxococcaceae bacterium]